MSNAFQPDQALNLRPDVVVTILEDGAVLLDLESKFFYSINSSGWALTQLFEAGATPAQALSRCGEWGASDEQKQDAEAFVRTLAEEGLVTAGADAAAPPEVELAGGWVAPSVEKHKEPLQKIMISAFDPTLPLAE